ncbi:MAG: alginate export family protein [Candidatus Omnitrophota bacterium]|nr:alginate export family protein [Candidatus Omnitrophota bacterium]
MSKRLIVVLALVFVVGLTFAAYAEVQNVKVSGDLNFLAIGRDNFDLGVGTPNLNKGRLFGTQARIRIDADLTDNVMTTIRLINERNWGNNTTANTNAKIDLDLAYVTLKEFLYSPLSVTVGRQEMRFGNALIIGNGNLLTNGAADLFGFPRDLSLRKAFDGIKAVLNYDPLVVDLIYAKVSNVNTNTSDSDNLFGVNVSYDVNKKLNVNPYVFVKEDKSAVGNAAGIDKKRNSVVTTGALISGSPIENLNTSLEGAVQFGNNRNTAVAKKHGGFALQGLADYTFAKVKYTPMLGAGYTYLSGNNKKAGWDAMFTDQRLNSITYAILPFTNMQVVNIKGSAKPIDDVTLMANYGFYRLNKAVTTITNAYTSTAMNMNTSKKDLGSALDLTALYDYTEDVQIGLTYGVFWKGTAFVGSKGDSATQLIGSMKVTF